MDSDIQQGLDKIRQDAQFLREFPVLTRRGQIVGMLLPRQVYTIVPTHLIISAVALLDDALEKYIHTHYPSAAAGLTILARRIEYLASRGKLKDLAKLLALKDARNNYAHEAGRYGSWEELDQILAEITDQLEFLDNA